MNIAFAAAAAVAFMRDYAKFWDTRLQSFRCNIDKWLLFDNDID